MLDLDASYCMSNVIRESISVAEDVLPSFESININKEQANLFRTPFLLLYLYDIELPNEEEATKDLRAPP